MNESVLESKTLILMEITFNIYCFLLIMKSNILLRKNYGIINEFRICIRNYEKRVQFKLKEKLF